MIVFTHHFRCKTFSFTQNTCVLIESKNVLSVLMISHFKGRKFCNSGWNRKRLGLEYNSRKLILVNLLFLEVFVWDENISLISLSSNRTKITWLFFVVVDDILLLLHTQYLIFVKHQKLFLPKNWHSRKLFS